MKAWWKIHDKPRGRWRPLIEWGVHFTPEEMQEIKILNIRSKIKFIIKNPDMCGNCGILRSKQDAAEIHGVFPAKVYDRTYNHADSGSAIGCNCNEGWLWHGSREIPNCYWSCRLPWRPGTRPDYSDFIQPVRDFLRQLVEEIERRFQEARESAPSDEWMLEEEFDSFSLRTLDSGVEAAERKLRVIRK